MRNPVLLVLLLAAALTAPAQQAKASVVIYRCTDAVGALTVQNDVPCPKGSKQDKRVIETPPPMPAYRPIVVPAAPEPVAAPPTTPVGAAEQPEIPEVADSDRLPPPPLFQCNTYDNDSYLSEDAEPEPRCVRLQTTGLDGDADNGAGAACQMMTDQCQRVADGTACDTWKQRLRETEAAWKFARAENAEANQAGYERVRKIVRESTCGR